MKTDRRAKLRRRWLVGILIFALGGVALAAWEASRFQRETARRTQHGLIPPVPPETVVAALADVDDVDGANAFSAPEGPDEFLRRGEQLRAQLGAGATPDAIMAALALIAAEDPVMAINLAQALGRTDAEKAAWVTDLSRQWTQRAPQAAWEWVTQLSAPQLDALAEGALPTTIFGVLAAQEPARLMQNIDTLLRAGERGAGLSPAVAVHLGLASLVEQGNPRLAREAVERWALDPARPPIGSSAYLTVANALRADDAAAASTWLQAMPASADRDEALTEFAAHWAQHDPVSALRWAEGLSSGELQGAAVQRTFFDWVERDAIPATHWLGDYLARAPVTPGNDRLIEALINLSGPLKNAPTDALAWAGLLADPAKRAHYEEKIAVRWSRADLAAASHFVWQGSTLSAEKKAEVVRRMHQPHSVDSDP